jgi:hypothetical protein
MRVSLFVSHRNLDYARTLAAKEWRIILSHGRWGRGHRKAEGEKSGTHGLESFAA